MRNFPISSLSFLMGFFPPLEISLLTSFLGYPFLVALSSSLFLLKMLSGGFCSILLILRLSLVIVFSSICFGWLELYGMMLFVCVFL